MAEAIGEIAPARDDRARRLRIARAYLRMRNERNEVRRHYETERMIAADRLATIWRIEDARKATIRLAIALRQRRALDASALLATREAYLAMEQRAVKAEQRDRGQSMEIERLSTTVADLRAKPHHFGNPVPLDALRLVQDDRDAARRSLASVTEERHRLAQAVERGAAMLDNMTERALRAEIALRAVEARRDREQTTPYRVNSSNVSFEVAA